MRVRDFAERVGVSRQAIYHRIKRDLAPYAKLQNGETLISIEALKLFDSKTTNDLSNSQSNEQSNLQSNFDTSKTSPTETIKHISEQASELERKQIEIEQLRAQLAVKDKQIDTLTTSLDRLLTINQTQSDNFASQFDRLTGQIDILQNQNDNQAQHIMLQSERLSCLLSQQQVLTHTIAADEQHEPESILQEPQEEETFWNKLQKFFKKI